MDTRVLVGNKAGNENPTSETYIDGQIEFIPAGGLQRANSLLNRAENLPSRTENLICGTGKVQGDSGKLRERVHHTIPDRTLLGAPVEQQGNALSQLFGDKLSDPSWPARRVRYAGRLPAVEADCNSGADATRVP